MVMKMEEGLDTGPIAGAEHVQISPDATAGEVHDVLAEIGAKLMVRALSEIEHSSFTLTPQPADGVTYAAKLANAETRIDWSRPAQAVHDHIRGLSPFPGAWCEHMIDGKPTRLKILRTTLAVGSGQPGALIDDALTVACDEGAVRILELQRAGGKAMKAEDFLRGQSLPRGTKLS
jgi:methionyl-tRNA formyltransferase